MWYEFYIIEVTNFNQEDSKGSIGLTLALCVTQPTRTVDQSYLYIAAGATRKVSGSNCE